MLKSNTKRKAANMRLDEANPQVIITGIGSMSLSRAIERVNEMLADLQQRASGPVNVQNWNTIKTLVDRKTLQVYIDSIAKALSELH